MFVVNAIEYIPMAEYTAEKITIIIKWHRI